jgi:hypothetical protein
MKITIKYCGIRFLWGFCVLCVTSMILACNVVPISPPVTNATDAVPRHTPTYSISKTTQKTTLPTSFVTPIQPKNTYQQIPQITTNQPQINQEIVSGQMQLSSVEIIREILGKVSIDRAINDLNLLTGEKPICNGEECYTIRNRLTGSEGLMWAKRYVYDELVSLSYSVEIQNWSTSKWSDQNIIARKPGATHPEEEVFFVAHLDGAGSNGVFRYPAADDNASGVVDILELARVLEDYSLDRTVVLLISTGEEQGTLGVQSYLSGLSLKDISGIKYVINIDMIGYDTNQDAAIEIWHANHSPSINLANMVIETIENYSINLEPRLVVGCG